MSNTLVDLLKLFALLFDIPHRYLLLERCPWIVQDWRATPSFPFPRQFVEQILPPRTMNAALGLKSMLTWCLLGLVMSNHRLSQKGKRWRKNEFPSQFTHYPALALTSYKHESLLNNSNICVCVCNTCSYQTSIIMCIMHLTLHFSSHNSP